MGTVSPEQCSCRWLTPAGSLIETIMNGFTKVFFLALVGTSLAAKPNDAGKREGKNLLGVFPFNDRNGQGRHAGGHAHHGDHHGDHGHHHSVEQGLERSFAAPRRQSNFDARAQRQGAGEEVDLSIGSIAAAGERCIDKVVMQEETEYDEVVTCKHSYSEKCHNTYVTDFEPQQEEDCEENFVKSCFIEYKKVASEEAVTFCHTPILLEGDGEEVCQTVYESACTTRYQEHDVQDDVVECETIQEEKCEDVTQGYTTEQKCTKWPVQKCKTSAGKVKKYSPETECKKVPREVCGPGTTQVPGQEECFDRKETVIQEVPEETCNLEPQRICKHVTKLVPLLKPTEECVDIPKEVCSRSRTNPRKVQKPVVKKWCYVPTAQSGLA